MRLTDEELKIWGQYFDGAIVLRDTRGFRAPKFLELITELLASREKIRVAEEAFERLSRMPFDPTPTCMTIERKVGDFKFTEFGPPRTNGWEGWAIELREFTEGTSKKALSILRGDK